MQIIEQIHCGACGELFDTVKELKLHMEECPAARLLTKLYNRIVIAGDLTSHPLAHLLTTTAKSGHLIRSYCYAVADDLNVLHRANLHADLCEKLGIRYESFRPFESSDIKKMPTREEAMDIFYQSLSELVDEIIVTGIDFDENPAKRLLTLGFFNPM